MGNDKTLTQKEVIEMAARAGANAALERLERTQKKENNKRRDRRFRNARLLMSRYRELKEYAENAVYSAEQADEIVDIETLMWDPNNRSEQIVESIKKSAILNKIMVAHTEAMVHAYDRLTIKSKNAEERRRYEVLYDHYISEETLSIDEIARKQNVETRTVYRDIEIAIEKVGSFFFGVDFIEQGE